MTRASTRRLVLSLGMLLLAAGLFMTNFVVAARPAHAANFTAGNYTELVNAIDQANALAGDDTISLTANIVLTNVLSPINSNITFEGNNFAIDGNDTYNIFTVSPGVNLTLNNITITRGRAIISSISGFIEGGVGGAIINSGGNISTTNTVFSNNSSIVPGTDPNILEFTAGGAIFSLSGDLNFVDTTFSNNTVTITDTAGVSLIRISAGGAIANLGGQAELSRTTFNNNQASVAGIGLLSGSFGGAIANVGEMVITNSTFYQNSVSASGGSFSAGGAIGNFLGQTYIINVTFAGNTATAEVPGTAAGWTLANLAGGVGIGNSILADPAGGNTCAGVITDLGHNLQVPDASCGGGIPVTDPKLDPAGLKNNGGKTKTIALLAGSPAINMASPEGCDVTDQRGVAREGICDIGAYEYTKKAAFQQPADLIGQLRVTPDRVAANDSENLISYTFTVKNVGQGEATGISLKMPIDPNLVVGYTTFNNPNIWVSEVMTDAIIVGLPPLSNNQVVSGTIVFRPNTAPAPVVGAEVFTRYTLKFTNPDSSDTTNWSNGVRYQFGAPGSNMDVSLGAVQLMTADAPNGSKVVYHSDFFIPNEIVTAWITLPDGTSKQLQQGNADATGNYSVTVDAAEYAAGTYVVAAFGQRSEEYGSGVLVVTEAGSSAKPATGLGVKSLGAKALAAPKSR